VNQIEVFEISAQTALLQNLAHRTLKLIAFLAPSSVSIDVTANAPRVNCDLTDASAGRIKSFLRREDVGDRAPKKKAKLDLRELNLQHNSFSHRLLLDLAEALPEASLALIDLRDNQAIDPRIIADIMKGVKHLEIHVDTGCVPRV
jgi:hypothetical protein